MCESDADFCNSVIAKINKELTDCAKNSRKAEQSRMEDIFEIDEPKKQLKELNRTRERVLSLNLREVATRAEYENRVDRKVLTSKILVKRLNSQPYIEIWSHSL